MEYLEDMPENPVGILAPSSLEFVEGLVEIWRANRIAVPLQPAHPLEELKYIAADTNMKEFYYSHAAKDRAKEFEAATGARGIEIKLTSNVPTGKSFAKYCLENSGEALIIYTSGTTGRPKGAVLSHENLQSQIRSLSEAWKWSASDRTLNVLPLHHVHGLINVLFCSLANCAECELCEKFEAAEV
ncbi:MAG: AMP-binding protein, partial [Bdellovibrionia bacterium]